MAESKQHKTKFPPAEHNASSFDENHRLDTIQNQTRTGSCWQILDNDRPHLIAAVKR
jgi:hypothetical protein|tara:strand:+ start:3731 stop:3901 length:171 start_codon:yes stop_codon:yes gene_type:complete